MQRSPKALVIGAAGNIGRPLVTYLRSIGYSVLEVDARPGWRPEYLMADITHPLDLLPAFDWAPDVVFLLAASVGRMTCEQAGSLAITTNLAGINNVLQLCKRTSSVCVFFSTSEVYGPGCEVMNDQTAVPQPNNRYGLSKWLGEQLVEYEVRTSKLRAVTLRPCMIYDEAEDVGDHRSAMIRFAANLARRKPIEVHRGSARGWLHVSDAVRAVEAAGHVPEYATINIGHPHIVPISVLAELIRVELGADSELIRSVTLPPQMTLVKHPTLERQRNLLGFEPLITLKEGVRRVCAVQSPHGSVRARRCATRRSADSPHRASTFVERVGASASLAHIALGGRVTVSGQVQATEPSRPGLTGGVLAPPLSAPATPADPHPDTGETPALHLVPAMCCACGDEPSEPVAVTEDFDLRTSPDTFLALQCQGCGSLFLSLVPGDDSAARIYPAGYRPIRVSRLIAPEPGAAVLSLGVTVPADGIGAPGSVGSYDFALLNLTLEHVPDPTGVLAAVHDALRPGARAVVVLHNIESPAFRFFRGRHWGGYDAPRQRRVLSVEGLRRLAAGAGLEVESLSTVAASDPWNRSMLRLCQDWQAPAWLADRFGDRAVASSALFAALDAVLRLLGRGALMVATLRRLERRPPP